MPTRVAFRRGAGFAAVAGDNDFRVRAGTTVTTDGFTGAARRVDIVTNGLVGRLRVTGAARS